MIFHSASIIAVLVGASSRTPTQILCVLQTPPDPWWEWLLQFCLSAVPVAGGVWVAWMAFRWTKKKEHEQWIRDHKRAEWRELLDAAGDCQTDLWIASSPKGEDDDKQPAITNAKLKLQRIYLLLDDRVFIDQLTLGPIMSSWNKTIGHTKEAASSSGQGLLGSLTLTQLSYSVFIEQLRKAAKKDLGSKKSG